MGLLAAAGCVADPGNDDPVDGRSPDPSPTDTSSPSVGSQIGTGITPAVNEPKADHAVYLFNEGTRERTVRVQVVREATGESVFDETLTVAPDTEREVYNLKQADPDGVETFTICGELAGPTTEQEPADTETPEAPVRDCITMRTDACHGTAHVTVQGSGELGVIYSIC